jgi:NADH dehydrogenase [ubiquinone] 1 alpha subcomplex assembly factor 7
MFSISYLLNTTPKSAGLIIDYGEDHAFTDSFRAIKDQKIFKNEDILQFTGEADLTAYVNFKAVKNVVHKFRTLKAGGILTQHDFLGAMGAMQLYNSYMMQSKEKEKGILMKQFDRIFSMDQMGLTYKFLYIHKNSSNPVYPFIDEIFNLILENQKGVNF